MSVFLQGQSITRDVSWFEGPPNSALTDVNNLQIEIVRVADGVTMIGPTSVGITHPTTGRYFYEWVTSPTTLTGQYVWVWTATDPVVTGSPLETSEVIEIAAAGSSDGVTGPCEPWTPILGDYASRTMSLTCAPAVSGYALAAATETLVALSGQRFGLCTVTIRPCRRSCYEGAEWPFTESWHEYGVWPRPLFFQGTWYNVVCGGCTTDCSCATISEVKLPRSVYDIIEVKVDGVVLAEDLYDLQFTSVGPVLVRTSGEWPVCNDFRLDDDQENTWSITARFGEPPTTLGQLAVGELMVEYVKALCGQADCALPPNAQSVVRQGITIELLDPNTVFASGLTGLRFPDRFIKTYNPNGLQERSRVYSVDGPSFRVTGR